MSIPPTPRKKGRGCFATGCLVVLALLLLGIGSAAAIYLRIPEKLGLAPSGARLLSGTPDRAAAANIESDLRAAGVDTTGVTLFVMPVNGESGTLAYAILDPSAGFTFPTAGEGDQPNPIYRMLTAIVSSPAIDDAHVEQVAIEYRDETGKRLATLTAGTSAIRELSAGRIDAEEFGNELHGSVDPGAVFGNLQATPAP